MSNRIGVVCGSFHRAEVERMLAHATDEAQQKGVEIGDVVWVPGSMEVPLALERLLKTHDAAACLGIIEKGDTARLGHGSSGHQEHHRFAASTRQADWAWYHWPRS